MPKAKHDERPTLSRGENCAKETWCVFVCWSIAIAWELHMCVRYILDTLTSKQKVATHISYGVWAIDPNNTCDSEYLAFQWSLKKNMISWEKQISLKHVVHGAGRDPGSQGCIFQKRQPSRMQHFLITTLCNKLPQTQFWTQVHFFHLRNSSLWPLLCKSLATWPMTPGV